MRLPDIKPLCVLAASACLTANILQAEEPRLNQIQVIGSHNSYHCSPPPEVLEIIGKFQKDAVEAWGYTHPTLTKQLADWNVRQFELDVYADPDGGLFSEPMAIKMAKMTGKALPEFDPSGDLKKPGFKVLHVPDLDCWSNNKTLRSALTEMLTWSNAHPDHLPLMILMECKDEAHPPLPTRPLPFTRARMLDLEKEILDVIPKKKILTPDDVRRDEATLPGAIKLHGWPELSTIRGKFIFALDNEGVVRGRYLEGNPALQERLLFVSAPDETNPAAGWFKCNDPVREFEKIQKLVNAGFLVRTRADEGASNNAMRDRAFATGAQWISTDNFTDGKPPDSRVIFPNGQMARPNILNGKKGEVIKP